MNCIFFFYRGTSGDKHPQVKITDYTLVCPGQERTCTIGDPNFNREIVNPHP